jgi:hypothetical protein
MRLLDNGRAFGVSTDFDPGPLRGVYDLTMFWGERFDVAHAYQSLTGGPPVSGSDDNGVFLFDADQELWRLVDSAGSVLKRLPDDVVFVVRKPHFDALVAAVTERAKGGTQIHPDASLDSRERETLLWMIATLAEKARINSDLSRAAKDLEESISRLGGERQARTLKKYLERALSKIDHPSS